MSASPSVVSTNVDSNATNMDHQGGFVEKMAERVRERAKELNLNVSSFGAAAGIKPSALSNYWSGKRPFPTEHLSQMAEVLRTNVDYLLTGKRAVSTAVADVADAEWEMVPFFDLRELTDTGKGEPISRTPFRKDWLNRTLGTASDLYLVRLLSDYESRRGDKDLREGDLVFCRECDPSDLADGYIVLWRREQGLKVARYSLQPRNREEGDTIYPEEVSDDQFVPIARILGRFIQRI
ncbi:helix-turn-helix transcriptional regulator [Sphingobium sp. TB-6]|uniref:helix-turn-helix domain-containing protein n=1 Tax=Sphingobium sp. TB-6 TaxID=2728850 RepID=UPI00146F3853|nr:helix-turn-helix transcriptional regulator [Sphingobium sp. TB-6]NML88383.1 helix-turn-helix transcriptional regulator [Sphingobium sp. TB-6]